MKWNFRWGKYNKREVTPELTERGVNVYHHENKIRNVEKLTQEAVEPATIKERKEDTVKANVVTLSNGTTRRLPIKTCPVCGKVFAATNNKQKFCSKACQQIAYAHPGSYVAKSEQQPRVSTAPTEKTTCDICGKLYLPKTHKQRYCSKECGAEAMRRRSAAWRAANIELDRKNKRNYYYAHKATVEQRKYDRRAEQRMRNKHAENALVLRKLIEAGVDDDIVAKYLQTSYGGK
jgi:hypothetical protein